MSSSLDSLPVNRIDRAAVTRWFAELTRKQLGPDVRGSTRQLEADIRAFIDTYNEDSKLHHTHGATIALKAVGQYAALNQ